MNTIIAYPEDTTQIEVLKAVIKALKIKYSVTKTSESKSPYNPEFVAKIKNSEKQYAEGKFIKLDKADIEKYLSL